MDDVISYIGASSDPEVLAYYIRSIIIRKQHASEKQLKINSFFQPTRSQSPLTIE
jgi:hypothetical protein